MIEEARRVAARSVNAVMTATYWLVGRRIVEQEQQGAMHCLGAENRTLLPNDRFERLHVAAAKVCHLSDRSGEREPVGPMDGSGRTGTFAPVPRRPCSIAGSTTSASAVHRESARLCNTLARQKHASAWLQAESRLKLPTPF